MKRILKFFLWINAIVLFILNIAMQLNVIDANKLKLIVTKEQAFADDCGDRIYCHCTLFGNCRASGTGNICAQSEPGGNIDCTKYDGNCGM